MKNLTDDQIQELLESKLMPPTDVLSNLNKQQLEAYEHLFQKLTVGPEQGLPFNFSSKVTAALKIKLKKRSDLRFNLLALLGILCGLIMICGVLTLIDINCGNQLLQVMLKFKWLIVFSSFILLSSLVFEQKVVEQQNG